MKSIFRPSIASASCNSDKKIKISSLKCLKKAFKNTKYVKHFTLYYLVFDVCTIPNLVYHPIHLRSQ